METNEVVLIPVSEINILNPRARNQSIAEEIRRNIRNVGLKRPITVTLNTNPKHGKKYDLVCGQGRLEAFIDAGEAEIPAIIIEVSKEGAHIMSLVENIARRNNNPMELLQGINYLKKQGYDVAEIAGKTGLSREWIRGIGKLLECGEERLTSAVEKGRMPLYFALKIATEMMPRYKKRCWKPMRLGNSLETNLLPCSDCSTDANITENTMGRRYRPLQKVNQDYPLMS